MTTSGEQRLLSYQHLPITEVTLHTQQQLRHFKHKSIIPQTILQCNTKMIQYLSHSANQTAEKQAKNDSQEPRINFKKWAKEVDKICGSQAKLNEVQKIQLFNNAVMKLVTSQPQLVLILPKLHALNTKDRKGLLQKCTFQ